MNIRYQIVVLAAVALVACGSSNGDSAPAAAATPASTVSSSEVSGTVPSNAIVTLLPASGEPPMPAESALMDQISKQFIPNVLIVRVGQPVDFHNGEDLPHNVTVIRRVSGAEVFNVSTERGQTYTHKFDRVGQYDVKCDIHEGMEATVIVARGPMTTIAENDGRFTLRDVPVGSYQLSITFEGRTVEQALEVTAAKTSVSFRP
jgi:plastocyanin